MSARTTDATTDGTTDRSNDVMLDSLRGVRDALSVSRVFAEPYDVGGVSVIPVARVAGGGGGGAGEGNDDDGDSGSGFGTGFGLHARGLGVYEVRNGELTWKPALDVDRAIRGGQILTGIVAVCVTLVMLRRTSVGG